MTKKEILRRIAIVVCLIIIGMLTLKSALAGDWGEFALRGWDYLGDPAALATK